MLCSDRMLVVAVSLFLLGLHAVVACTSCKCACAVEDTVVRLAPGTNMTSLGGLRPSECVEFKGDTQIADHVTWGQVDWRQQVGWIDMANIHLQPCPANTKRTKHSAMTPDCPHIVSRAEWGARPPRHPLQRLPELPRNLYIHHGATVGCSSPNSCARLARSYQNYHMDTKGWVDVAYSFLVGEDGRVYEGRGWGMVGAHTYRHNTDGLGICMMGNFQDRVPNDAALTALDELIHCAVVSGKIRTDYHLVAHRDVRRTTCPGQALYDLIRTWPHYSSDPL